MYIIVTSLYPNGKIKEAIDIYAKMMTKYPDDASLGTPIVQVAVRATHNGIKVIHISEIKKGKFEEFYAFASKRMHMFDSIEGYSWTVKPFMNMEEALKSVGM